MNHCVLSEVDAHIHGCIHNYASLTGNGRDPTSRIHAAGWREFEYYSYDLEPPDHKRTQLADRFGIVLYLATLSPTKHHLRKQVYASILETIDETDDGVLALLEEVLLAAVLLPTHHKSPMAPQITTTTLYRLTGI